jgi:hypothetical protein
MAGQHAKIRFKKPLMAFCAKSKQDIQYGG